MGTDEMSGRARELVRPVSVLIANLVSPQRAPAVERFVDTVAEWQKERMAAIPKGVAGENMTEVDLLDAIADDEAKFDLLREGFAEAQETHLRDKSEMLGRIVREGLLAEDSVRIDESRLLLRAVAGLEMAHIRVVLALDPDRPRKARTWIRPPDTATLARILDQDRSTLSLALNGLVAEGLVENVAEPYIDDRNSLEDVSVDVGNPQWKLTTLGERLLRFWKDSS
jgi:DNA-binding MarR family transcriptional regulator